jgi:hypothetical protein
LLRETRTGAWAEAVLLRDVIFNPLPAWAGMAAGAGAVRATMRFASELLSRAPFDAFTRPLFDRARDVSDRLSATQPLGFNPLEALARFLRQTSPANSRPRDTNVE